MEKRPDKAEKMMSFFSCRRRILEARLKTVTNGYTTTEEAVAYCKWLRKTVTEIADVKQQW